MRGKFAAFLFVHKRKDQGEIYGYFTMTSLRQWTTLKSVPRPLRV